MSGVSSQSGPGPQEGTTVRQVRETNGPTPPGASAPTAEAGVRRVLVLGALKVIHVAADNLLVSGRRPAASGREDGATRLLMVAECS